MPNIITHKLFAEDVYHALNDTQLKCMIKRNLELYYIGSQGPDFLFFSHLMPWDVYKSHELNRLGSRMHNEHINDFYECAMHSIQKQTNKEIQERMIVYLFGHLCHWALDKTAHPYIYYFTGKGKKKNSSFHHRLESIIDARLLEKKRDLTIKEYPYYKLCEYDVNMLQAIARIYVAVSREVYHVDLKVHDIRETLDTWYEVQKFLYDPGCIKYACIHGVEKILHKEWQFSGNIVRNKEIDQLDLLNEERKEWKHPCDDKITSTASFLDLYDDAIITASKVIKMANWILQGKAGIHHLLHIIDDQTYTRGMKENKEMRYFNIIFEKQREDTK